MAHNWTSEMPLCSILLIIALFFLSLMFSRWPVAFGKIAAFVKFCCACAARVFDILIYYIFYGFCMSLIFRRIFFVKFHVKNCINPIKFTFKCKYNVWRVSVKCYFSGFCPIYGQIWWWFVKGLHKRSSVKKVPLAVWCLPLYQHKKRTKMLVFGGHTNVNKVRIMLMLINSKPENSDKLIGQFVIVYKS